MDQNYSTLKNQSIIVPTTVIDLGTSDNRYGNIYLEGNINLGNVVASESTLTVPKISSISFPNNATAGNPDGGETVTVTGTGFLSGATVYVANVLVAVSTVVNNTSITFTSPVKPSGNYALSIVNIDGGSATFVPGITYSELPAFSTSAGSLGTSWEGNSVSTSIAAESDSSLTYTVTSGSLPGGLSLSSSGTLSGSLANVSSGDTTYNFTVTASDQEQQKATQNFSYTVTGDSLSWASPANNTSYDFNTNMTISNISLNATSTLGRSIVYTANTLPTGITLSGNTISGSPSVSANTTSLITASTTTKTSSVQLNFNVTPLTVTVNYLLVAGGGAGGRDNNYGGGGGGAGGVIGGSASVVVGSGVTTVTIGAGGTSSVGGGTPAQGVNTTLTGGMAVTAYGGGRGGGDGGGYWWDVRTGGSGGSGGGGSSTQYSNPTPAGGKGVYPGSAYVSSARQGYDSVGGSPYGAGGGGAGGVGYANSYPGNGTSTFSSVLSIVSAGSGGYIGGGGGGCHRDYAPAGGLGGGGSGARDPYNLPNSGSTNTGGGGGGGRATDAGPGGNGGSGIAILYFPTGTSVSVTGSPSTYTSGGNTYYKFTSSGTITF